MIKMITTYLRESKQRVRCKFPAITLHVIKFCAFIKVGILNTSRNLSKQQPKQSTIFFKASKDTAHI